MGEIRRGRWRIPFRPSRQFLQQKKRRWPSFRCQNFREGQEAARTHLLEPRLILPARALPAPAGCVTFPRCAFPKSVISVTGTGPFSYRLRDFFHKRRQQRITQKHFFKSPRNKSWIHPVNWRRYPLCLCAPRAERWPGSRPHFWISPAAPR